MKYLFFAVFTFIFCSNLFSQNVSRVDTTFVIDSLWRNDTLFIIKKIHLSVIIRDTNYQKLDLDNKNYNFNISTIQHSYFSPTTNNNFYKKEYLNYLFLIPEFNLNLFNSKYKSENIFLDTSINPLFSIQGGINIFYKNKFIDLNTGISLNLIMEKFLFNQTWTKITTNYYNEINDNSFWNKDTIWVLNTDSLLIGDTVYSAYYDSSYIEHFDTTKITNITSQTYLQNTDKNNRLIVLNIPFLIGKHFYFNNFSIYFLSGILTSMVLNKKYFVPYPTQNVFYSIYFPFFYFSVLSKLILAIDFSESTNFWFGFNFSFPLNPLLSISDNKKFIYQYGITAGIKIKILKRYF